MSSTLSTAIQEQNNAARLLLRLAENPPCSLVLEGGHQTQRSALAGYLLKALHCKYPGPGPCLECDMCVKIEADAFRDLFRLTPLQGLSVDEIREMRPALSQSPHHGWRMVVVEEAGEMNASCANALLKAVEEPVTRNIFVFLANERQSILPTIVSRSFVLTLGRTPGAGLEPGHEGLYSDFSGFVVHGKGFMHKCSKKDSFDLSGARRFLVRIRLDLARGMRGEESLFQDIEPVKAHSMILSLQKAEQALSYKVRTDLVMQWLALNTWKIFNKKQ
ncbi:hypothetical protein [Desulfonatronospira sp.]|uniref:hypothetical protein n=1 Tax=Desulfonatronospira sp. TaxID=1962951 RepID=UPI0025B8877D|nr:hypothetical protein [Desulfonatronospira sp.]